MTTPTREQVIEWAEEAGAIQLHKEGWDTVIQGGIGDMQRFAVLAMEAGRDQGLREAKEVCEAMHDEDRPGDYADAIDQLRAVRLIDGLGGTLRREEITVATKPKPKKKCRTCGGFCGKRPGEKCRHGANAAKQQADELWAAVTGRKK